MQTTLGPISESIKSRPSTTRNFLLDQRWHALSVRYLIGALMIGVYLWIIAGIFSLLMHLYQSAFTGWDKGAEAMIKEVVLLLAAFELIRTLQSYLALRRVKVTFSLDAALVVLIGELIGLWYGHYSAAQVFISLGVITVLIGLRIVTSRYSPNQSN